MAEINLTYFLFGLVGFMIIRIIDEMKMFNPNFEAFKGYQKVFYLLFGMIFLLSAINGIIFQWKLKNILPIIFLFIGSALFISDSFVKPSKNYLISLSISIIIGSLLIIPLYEALHGLRVSYNIPYLGFVGIAIVFLISLGIGLSLYFLFNYKYPQGLDELWDGTKVWRILNNRLFTFILCIFMVIETFLGLRASTLIALFYAF